MKGGKKFKQCRQKPKTWVRLPGASPSKKAKIKHQDDKSLIEFLLGKSNDEDESPKKDKKINKNIKETKNIKKTRMNIHNKRKQIKFSIAKKNT